MSTSHETGATTPRVLLAKPRGLLRGRRPGRRRGREGPRDLRRPGVRPQGDRAQPPRRDHAGRARRGLRRRDRRGARGRHGRLLRARRLPAVHAEAAARELRTVDATCPLVTKVHQEAKRFARDDYDILLIGHEGHEEVEGTAGEAPEHMQLVDGPDRGRRGRRSATRRRSSGSRRRRCRSTRPSRPCAPCASASPRWPTRPSDDICYATQNRQVAVKQMAPECDLVLVVGSRNSSNSVRLVEVALQAGASALAPGRPRGRDRRGLARGRRRRSGSPAAPRCPRSSSATSCTGSPTAGWADVEEITTANEKLTFSLPRELKRDMKPQAVR